MTELLKFSELIRCKMFRFKNSRTLVMDEIINKKIKKLKNELYCKKISYDEYRSQKLEFLYNCDEENDIYKYKIFIKQMIIYNEIMNICTNYQCLYTLNKARTIWKSVLKNTEQISEECNTKMNIFSYLSEKKDKKKIKKILEKISSFKENYFRYKLEMNYAIHMLDFKLQLKFGSDVSRYILTFLTN